MGAYEDLLQAADNLGFKAPSSEQPTQRLQCLEQAQQLAGQCRQLHELELRIAELAAHLTSRTVTDRMQLSARVADISKAAGTLQLICASKDAIADQLRSASTRPSVPVAPEYQQHFADMLRCAASNAAVLQEGLAVLQWAASLSDKPSCWEDQLRIIRDSAQSIRDCASALHEFDQQLTGSTGTGALVAADHTESVVAAGAAEAAVDATVAVEAGSLTVHGSHNS